MTPCPPALRPPPGDARRVRAYVGAEFCQSLLPGTHALLEARAAARALGGFTLVTPPVTDAGLRRVAALLDTLDDGDDGPPAEVVVNDWGVLGLVAQRPRLEPVLGRLLTRMLRDPRLTPDRFARVGTASGQRAMQQSGITSAPFRDLLRARGVRRVELDAVPQGIAIDFDALGLAPTLHAPFGYVTTGRLCLFAAEGQPAARRFEVGVPCHQECRAHEAAMTDPAEPGAALVAAGNTVFQRHTRASIAGALGVLAARGGRLVVRDRPFDEVAWATEDRDLARRWAEA